MTHNNQPLKLLKTSFEGTYTGLTQFHLRPGIYVFIDVYTTGISCLLKCFMFVFYLHQLFFTTMSDLTPCALQEGNLATVSNKV